MCGRDHASERKDRAREGKQIGGVDTSGTQGYDLSLFSQNEMQTNKTSMLHTWDILGDDWGSHPS